MIGENNKVHISGKPTDEQTRCVHYHSENDIIAIKFKCCDQFYPCYSCHEETAGHAAQQWSRDDWKEKAILCGVCKHQLTIEEYLTSSNRCPSCRAQFNPNCSKHYHLYFEMD